MGCCQSQPSSSTFHLKASSSSSPSAKPIPLNLTLVGDPFVGKSALLRALQRGSPGGTGLYSSTTGYQKAPVTVTLSNNNALSEVDLLITDITGASEYERLRRLLYPETDAFLLCFSLEDGQSLENIASIWAPEVRHFSGTQEEVPLLLVGLKAEVKPRTVRRSAARAVAQEIGASLYLEASAAKFKGVRTLFREASKLAKSNTKL